ncbi:MAG TPA: hypothetical protein DCP57_08600 [Gammaproteobacteria bacterium]|jgi:hypothetical protein|nr:hypothetical protein [Gammaproteobacteria bacterium]HBK17193.1 hypothetical protein [Gammaproteobacteria bacterium]|tara:strand:- start:3866 stop:4159 length:294 start_codon:yes stop_codon:yes gene_type:complete
MQKGCVLKYLVRGVSANRDAQRALDLELRDMLPSIDALTILPVVEGFSVELEVNSISPFNSVSFEPYVAEHVLQEAVSLRCDTTSSTQIQLIKGLFY